MPFQKPMILPLTHCLAGNFLIKILILISFNSNKLFYGIFFFLFRKHPLRIYFAIVESEKVIGTQASSPFEFYSKWKYSVTDPTPTPIPPVYGAGRSDKLDLLFDFLKETAMFEAEAEEQQEVVSEKTKKGKGRPKGKKSETTTPSKPSFLQKACKFLSRDLDEASTSFSSQKSCSSSVLDEDAPLSEIRNQRQKQLDATKKTISLKKCQLQLNFSDIGKKINFF